MSFCTMPIAPAHSAVAVPMTATIISTSGACANNTALRPIKYTPAVTIVAAWMSAETGVGPSIASGSQTYSGICADLPTAPTNNNRAIVEITPNAASAGSPAIAPFSSLKLTVPNCEKASSTPRMNATSPMRLTTNAFLPASAADGFAYQKPMSRYEQSPTPSQPTNSTMKLSPSTRSSMNAANRFRYAKYRAYSYDASSIMYAVE